MVYLICPTLRTDIGYFPMHARKYSAPDECAALVLFWREVSEGTPQPAKIGADVFDTHADETAREWVGYVDDLAAFAATT